MEELEPRILFSADVPMAVLPDASAAPAVVSTSLQQAPATQAGDAASAATHKEVAFVDASVPNADQLVDLMRQQADSGRTLQVYYLKADSDGVQQISSILASLQGVDAVHILSHGADGSLQLGSTTLNAQTIGQYAAQLTGWHQSMNANADLMLYGCDVAQDAQGQHFVEDLQLLTGTNVAASTDLTGDSTQGGNWTLEYQLGRIDTAVALDAWHQADWHGLLATYTVTNTNDSGAGSLRAAITSANSNVGTDTINFNISSGTAGTGNDAGAYVITLASGLPTITEAVTIDASTQAGYVAGGLHTVVLDGNDAGAYGFQLSSTSDGSTIRGLVIRNFTSYGIYTPAGSDNHTIVGNYIGSFYADGSNAGVGKGNATSGIFSQGANATIGGTTAADRNVISGNSGGYGIYLSTGADGTVIKGNYIGTNAAGTSVFSTTNPNYGIMVETSATNITIGGTAAGAGNVVSGNLSRGIWVTTTGTVTIQGNYIGTDYTGTVDLGNAGYGIYLDDAGTATIGGTAAGAGNVISGNSSGGIYAINGGVTVQGNIIGLNASGTAALGNTGSGIEVRTTAASTIGGNTAAAANYISGNTVYGIDIETHYSHVVKGNYIGLGKDGTTLLGNGSAGVLIDIGDQTIGGKGAGDGNTIAGNGGAGIAVTAGTGTFFYRNSIYSNTGLGIDLNNDGVSVNDAGDADGGINNLNNYAVISSAIINGTTTTITGSIDLYGHASADTVYIELFSSPSLDATGYGEGKTYLGYVSITTDATTGNAAFTATVTGVSAGDFITAVANAETGYTGGSEFSPGLAVVTAANAPKGKLIWTDNDQQDNWVANWTGSGFTAPGMTGLTIGDDITMMAVAEAPTRDEYIMIGSADASGKIEAIVWNGSTWTAPLGIPVATPSAAASQYNSFALAYESQSGDAMLVWDNGNTGTTGLSYATWNGTAWSSISTITAPSSGEPYQMKLAASPTSDQMVLVATTNTGSNNYAMVWSGSSWGNSQTLGTNTNKQYFEINAAYESQSGRAIVVYDNSASDSSSVQYRIWSGSAWGSEQTVAPPSGITAASDVYNTVIASDPTSNRIAIAVKDAVNEVWVSVWDGSSTWGSKLAATTSGVDEPDHHPSMALAFESQSGDLLLAYGKAAGPNVYYRTWTNAGGWSSEATGPSMGATDITYAIKLYADPYSNTVMMAVQDGGLDLNMVAWDGSSWGSVTTLDANTGEYYRENFSFAWNIYAPPTLSNIAGNTFAYTEDAAAGVIDQGTAATASDGDGIGFSGGNLTVSFAAGSTSAEDVLSIRNQGTGAGQIGVSGSNVTYGGTIIGSYTGGSSGAALVITLNAAATNAAVGALVNNITYVNSNNATPSTTSRTVRYNVTNARGITSVNYDATVTVAAVNDAPTATITPTSYSATEQVSLTLHGTGLSIADVDAGSATVQATLSVVSGTITVSAGSTGVSVSNSGTSSVTLSGTLTQINNLLAGNSSGTITYIINSNAPPASDTLTLQASDLGNTGSGGTLTASDTATINITAVNDSPTGSVSISGTATQGQTLTASNNIADGDGMGAITYHWLRGGVDTGSTGSTYLLTESDVGAVISAKATYTDAYGTAESVTSAATPAVANVNDVPTGTVTVSGTATQGQTLTASNNIADADGMGTITYHWLRGGVDTGSTGTTYALTEADVGSTIAARATYTDGHGTAESVTSTATASVANVNDSPTGSVTVTGTATQGQTLTASNNIADADGMGTITYHWLRGGVDTGSTGTTYVLSEADVGSAISARATYTDGHGTAETVTSSATAAVANVNDAPTGSVTVTGTATQGQTLTASNNIADADGMGTITYHWLRGGVDTGSTGTTYVLSEADVGAAISAQAAYTDGHGTAETVTSSATAAVANVNDSPTGSVTVTGTATQGQTLTASNNIADADGMGTITYHWLRGGVDTGSTGTTYVLSEADVGSTIAAKAYYTDGHGTAETVTSAVTAAVANVNDAPTGSVTVTGTATQGQTLTASNNIADADGMGTITYHWLRGGVDTGSTGTTYVLSEADVGSTIAAKAYYTDGHGTAETVTSSATASVANVNDSPTGSVTVTGTATQGQTLTASNNIADADGMGTITYHWLRGGVDTGSTGTTYVLSEADVGSTIAAKAYYTDGHGTAETVTSSATASVANVNDSPTGSVTVTGTATQGQTLTASNNIADADGMGTITYHWLRDGADTGSTGSTYLLAEADVGAAISAQAAYTDGHGTAETVTSSATAAVANVNDSPTGSVTITGTATQGQTLTASNNIADADGMGTITYHWLRDGVDTGATGSTYLLAEADVGAAISAQAAYTDGHGTAETVTSSATAAVANVNDSPTGSVTITGTATQGQTLTASNNIADADGMGAITYHWLRGGVDTGSTGSTYLLAEADVGSTIAAKAYYTDGHGTAETVTSSATAAVANVNDSPTGSVTVTGTATQGQTLTASNNIADADGMGTITYHWLRDGLDTGATGSTYLLAEADVGAAISAQAAYTDGHGTAETVTSSATSSVANVNDSPTGSVTVTGTATQGQTLTASNNIADADGIGAITYHWLRDGVDTGSTGSAYLLGEADVGAAISAQAAYTDGHGTAESVTSSATAAVANVNDAPTGSVTVTGTATQGQTLTASNNIADADGIGAITYHWLRDGVDTGSTGSAYLLGEADVGAAISAQAAYTDGHGTAESVTSSATAAVANVNDAPTGSVTVTGTATQGQTLTASNNISDADGMGAITYHWLRDGVDTGSTGSTYLLAEADVGAAISAQAAYTDGHGTAETVTSAATAAVANVNDSPTGSVTITGMASKGETLTATNNIADADGMGAITYHWLRDGVDTGSTGGTYVLGNADVGTVISAQASYTDGHGTLESVTSAATATVTNVNNTPSGSVTITGTATQGQTLNASDNITDADGMGTITYHWLRDGVDTGSTGASYLLGEADVGKAISVHATYVDGQGTAETVASSATAAVANVNDSPTGFVTVTGTATQGQTLTASNNIADADGMGAITYHWLRGGVDTGSTNTTYVLSEADVGSTIAAKAYYTDGHGTAETVTSAVTAAVANVNDSPTGSVTITGTATQGQTLTASNNIADADGMGAITYHWLRDGVDTGSTGSTYLLAEADVGAAISAQAAYTDGHGTAETVTSSATSAVANVNDTPTGSVTVTGTATQGQTLAASNNIADADGMGTITYHWLRDGVDTGSTGSTYLLAEADVGAAISAQAAYTDGHGTAETVTSSATAAVANVNDSPTGSVTVTGTATQGQTLTASNNIADADGMGTITYHWLRGGVDTGSTGTTYVLSEADVGSAISARATYTDGHGTAEIVTSSATAAVANVNDSPTGSVTVTGTATQGQTLTASNNIADADGMGTITYHWLRGGVDTGSTGTTYVLSEADVGSTIAAKAYYTDGHGTAETVTGAATAAVANVNDSPTGSVTITGTTTQGQTLTASNNIADADGMGTITYHWLRDGVDTGATGSTYLLAEADVGAAISAQAAYTDGHGTAETVTSSATAAVANVNDSPTGSVTVTGTATQGQTLTASNNIADADGMGAITYHWLRGGVDTGSTGTTYVLSEADVGSTIAARAYYTDGHGTAETVTSSATAAVANVNDLPTGSVTVSGTATQGQTLTASNNIADADGMGTITYHWLRDGVDTGSTGSAYQLAEADVGSTIAAKAYYTDGHSTAETVTSAATAAVANVNDSPTGSVTVTGTATQGQTLTASNNIADADGMGTITYHWLRGGVDTGSVGTTYVLSEADVGSTIAARAIYTDGHGTAETVTSTATASVANVNDAPTGSVTVTGTATQGQTLTASNNIADADGMGTITYHWLRGGLDTGSVGTTYVLSEADVGSTIAARATYTDGHGTAETVTSTATASVANVNDAPTGSVTVTGTATQGQTLTASNNIADADGMGTITYHWLRDGIDTGATGSTYLLAEADVGAAISAQAAYTDGHGTAGTVTSSATAAVANVNDSPTGSVTITGTTTQGQTLTASNNIADADGMGAITYHWLRGGVDTGSTGTTYVLSEADVGSTIAAKACYTDGHGTAETVTSAATAAVANVNDTPTGSVTVTGTPTQGQTLTASNNIADADGMGTITYHWLRDGVDTSATGSTYLLTPADLGAHMSVTAVYVDGGGVTETVASSPTSAVLATNSAPVMSAQTLNAVAMPSKTWQAGELLAQATDPDNDALTVVIVQAPQHGTLSFLANGDLQYTADPGYTGTDTFAYRAFDGQAMSASARQVSIQAGPGAPITPSQPTNTDTPSTPPRQDPQPTETKAPDSATTKPETKPTTTVPTAQPTPDNAGRDTSSENLHQHISSSAWGRRGGDQIGIANQTLFNTSTTSYSGALAGKASNASPILSLLDLIQPNVERAAGINLLITPLSSITHALPASGDAGLLGHASDDAPATVRITRAAGYSTGLGLAVGTVWWTARISGLVTSALISTPAWRSLDPLPVVNASDSDEDSPEQMGDGDVEHLFDADPPIEQELPIIQ
jgi:cell shape-determining protein MreC